MMVWELLKTRCVLEGFYFDYRIFLTSQHKGMEYMKAVAETKNKKYQHLVPSAQFNVGQAYLQGFGIKQSDEEAIKWWTLAASAADQDDIGCIKSQNALGMIFSRNDSLHLEQVTKLSTKNFERFAHFPVFLVSPWPFKPL